VEAGETCADQLERQKMGAEHGIGGGAFEKWMKRQGIKLIEGGAEISFDGGLGGAVGLGEEVSPQFGGRPDEGEIAFGVGAAIEGGHEIEDVTDDRGEAALLSGGGEGFGGLTMAPARRGV